jgi:hemolysin activation/secretion protein
VLNGQVASKNLDSSEKFYLGGPGGVRAYPSSEAGGSDGMLLNVEARLRLSDDVTVSAFYDWGQVRVNHDNDFSGAAANNRLRLQGAGLGLGWVGPVGTSVKLTWAHRIGSNPNPTTTGQDQDGTLHKHRIWLWGNLVF